jgi:hypothetical protein
MKKFDLDRNYFTQIGLDSGALTMLGTIVHSLKEPGEYRGTVRRGSLPEASFYISADRNSPVAHVNIDLASLVGDSTKEPDSDCCKEKDKDHFVVNPRGYVLFRVAGGPGGYRVHVRKADEDDQTRVYDSSQLEYGDIFSAIIVRPGRYSLKNLVNRAEAEIAVSYPVRGKTAYRPPTPVSVRCDSEGFDPGEIRLKPGQGLNCLIETPARIKIELVEPDDGQGEYREPVKRGRQKRSLSEQSEC